MAYSRTVYSSPSGTTWRRSHRPSAAVGRQPNSVMPSPKRACRERSNHYMEDVIYWELAIKKPLQLIELTGVFILAERQGFEPWEGYKPSLVFKTSAFNRSAISPKF